MNRTNRWLMALAVTGGLSLSGIGIVHAGLLGSASSTANQLEEHWKHPHMHNAMDHLKTARHELEDAEDIFHSHKEEALDHVDHAIKEIKDGLHEQHDDAALPSELPAASKLDERYPHLHKVLEELRIARKELDDSDKVFSGHRDSAMEQTDKAIKQVEDAIHE